jgi:threonine dehydrogenase-like Zn-dependent dehydrogenase
MVLVAGFKNFAEIPGFVSDKLILKDLTLRGAYSHDYESVDAAIRVIESNKYPLEALSTHTFPLDEADRALRTLGGEGEPDAIHVTILGA